MIAFRKITTLLLTTVFLLAFFTFGVIAAEGVTVDIVSFSRGAQDDLRSSELLEAKVEGYDGNVRELTYEWTSTIGTYLYVYNNHNMYGINNTDGEVEIYNSAKSMSGSENMAGRTYNKTFKGTGYAWAAIYGANVSSENLVGVITVKVYDAKGNLLATDSHEGTREKVGSSWLWNTYENHGIVESDFANDISHVRFGLFEGDTKNVKILLGESSIVHITCVECTISQPTVTKGQGIIELEVDTETQEWHIKSVKGTTYGDAKVQITIKKGNCKFHKNVSVTREIEVFVYKKPTTTSTATAIMLDNLDDNCTYYIGGVKGEKKIVDGKEYVVFENLTPNTQYQVEVVGQAADTEPVYAYVYETTKPAHVGTVKVLLNGTYDTSTGIATGTLVNIEDMMPEVKTIYLRYEDSEIYFPLTNESTGIYSSELSDGNYTLYYSKSGSGEKIQLGDQILTVAGASRTREVFFNSVNYDVNGGVPTIDTEYYLANSEVNVTDVVPVKEGYLFTHWTDGTKTYKAGDVLTDKISKPYTLVAQYIDANDVYVDIVIKHTSEDGKSINNDNGMHDVKFAISQRLGGGEYNVVTTNNVEWDGTNALASNYFNASYNNNNNTTTYTAKAPILVNVAKNAEYTFTSEKSSYNLVSVENKLDANGDWRVIATLQFDPNNFDFTFAVELDEESKKVANELKPVAVNVKVTTWCDPVDVAGEDLMWWHISQHRDTYVRVALDANGKGVGTYPVWMATTDTQTPYSYRIEVVSFETADGTVLSATDKAGTDIAYATEYDRYTAKIFVEGGNTPAGSALSGAYYNTTANAQTGTVTALVNIAVYDVTFVPNGGKLLGTTENTVLTKQISYPELRNYVPTREGGYAFAGWFIADENGNMTAEEPVSGAIINKDVTLIAKWIEPLTIQGYVAVAGVYTTVENGVEVKHEIHQYDRLNTVYVYLQKINNNGYAETVKYVESPIMSPRFEGDYGKASYTFNGIENNGEQYRIMVSTADYNTYYNNDASSISFDALESYKSESEDDLYLAEFTNDATVNVANVYAYLEFDPKSFDLEYQVDSSLIGNGFTPDSAEVLVLYDTGDRVDPQAWTPISQMVYGNTYIGNESAFVNDIAKGSESVWMMQAGTGAAYDYSIKVNTITIANEEIAYDNYSLPFYIAYNGSARYDDVTKEQTQLLTATLIPRMYTVTFDMGDLPEGTVVNGMDKYETVNYSFEDSFYWSFGTEINAVPEAEGYVFLGWFDEDGNKVSVIPANTSSDVTVTAKWTVSITFDVMGDAGFYAEKRDAEEKEGVIAFNARVSNIDEAKNIISAFGIFVYDTTGTSVEVTATNADMAQLVNDNGEFHIIIYGITADNFDNNVLAVPYVVVNGEIISGKLMTVNVSDSQKWLGAKNAD